MAVLIPITSPLIASSGPPLLPGLMAASVCRNFWNWCSGPPPRSRSFALMMPAVTVACSPNGEPIATAQSPTCTESELPILAATSGLLASILITARSVSASEPITLAGYLVVVPAKVT